MLIIILIKGRRYEGEGIRGHDHRRRDEEKEKWKKHCVKKINKKDRED